MPKSDEDRIISSDKLLSCHVVPRVSGKFVLVEEAQFASKLETNVLVVFANIMYG